VSSPTASPPDVGVVIVAAGAGVRAGPGEPKQFRPIHGVPMLLRTLRPFTSHPAVGQVVVAVPAGFAEDGLPLAVQLIGRPADEATLLSLAAQLEAERPWADRRPPLS